MRVPTVMAVLLSGAMWFGSTGIYHVWLLAWLAPLPLLLVLPGLRPGPAALAAWAAAALGASNFAVAYQRALAPAALVALVVVTPLPTVAVALAWRAVARRAGAAATALAYPALVVGAEYVVSLVSPNGTFGSVAYSQADVLAVVQLASLTGLWGISFVVSLVPAALAAAWRGREVRASRDAGLVLAALPLAAVLLFGAARLVAAPSSATVRVGLAASDTANRAFTRRQDEALAAVRGYALRVGALAARDVQAVVLPEKFVAVEPEYAAGAEGVLSSAARRWQVTVVAGFSVTDSAGRHNQAVVFGPDGRVVLRYDKVHLVPGLEASFAPGSAIGVVRGASVPTGVAICKDMDFTATGRAYAGAGIGLLLVPAWDFGADAWLHSRMAILRSVEGGYALARVASDGLLTVSDPRGRIVAERASASGAEVLVAAAVRVGGGGTFYSRAGDWFAWLCLATALAIVAGARRRHE